VWDKGAGGWLSPEEIYEQYPYEGWHEVAGRDVRYGLKTKPEVLHAESNAIAKLAKSTNSGLGATMFVTTLHVWSVPNLYTKAVLGTFYIATLIGILVALRSWKSQE